MAALRKELGEVMVSFFKAPGDLSNLVSVSLYQYEQKKRIRSGLEEQRQSIVQESEQQKSQRRPSLTWPVRTG